MALDKNRDSKGMAVRPALRLCGAPDVRWSWTKGRIMLDMGPILMRVIRSTKVQNIRGRSPVRAGAVSLWSWHANFGAFADK
jgi:hypothetical protein